MKPVLIVYGTREGQTRRIAEHIGSALERRGHRCEVLNARSAGSAMNLSSYAGAIVASSVHYGRHKKETLRFVQRHLQELERLPTAFVSVNLTQAGIDDQRNPPDKRARDAAAIAELMEQFFRRTGFRPKRAKSVAGALMYREYNAIERWLMKRIARANNGSTDTSQNHEYTDWQALDAFAADFGGLLPSARAEATP